MPEHEVRTCPSSAALAREEQLAWRLAAVADAHTAGARPFARQQYIAKFRTLTDGIIDMTVQDRFLAAVTRLPELDAAEVCDLALPSIAEAAQRPETWGIF